MDCPEENEIVDFAHGALAKSERAKVEAHIDECGSCLQLVGEIARIFAESDPPSGELSAPDFSGSEPPPSAVESFVVTEGAFSPSGATLGASSVVPEQVLPRGSKLGRYVVIDRIGAGGMGIVYAAYDPELDRKIALKVLRRASKGGDRADHRTRLVREAQAMAKLSHPNVITVHDVGTLEQQVFIAMEFIDGGTLGEWLKEPRTWREILRVFRAAGEGLQAAHAVGLVHRDFKPDNVLLDSDGRILVTDFGLARAAAGHTGRFADVGEHNSSSQALLHASLTQTGALVGTPAYMAPEQLLGRSTDAHSDQFSFCVALYEALHGERPFAGKALVELVHNVSSGNIRPPPKNAAVPRWLRRAVIRGLATEPQARYPTMRALITALHRDPRRQWTRWGAITIPTVLLVAGLVGYQQVDRSRLSQCADIEAELTSSWGQPRQAEIEGAFKATSRPYAEAVFTSTKRAIDAYATVWVDLRSSVCRDRMRGQAADLTALRVACLERRKERLGAISDLFVEADGEVVEKALATLHALPDLNMCTDVGALAERETQSASAREAAQRVVEEIDAMLAEVSIAAAASQGDVVLALADRIVAASRGAAYRRGEAEGLYYRGVGLAHAGKQEPAESAFHQALSASLAAGHAEVMANASAGLVRINGTTGGSLEESERWATHGLAALDQMGGHPQSELQLFVALAAARRSGGDYAGAHEALDRGMLVLDQLTFNRKVAHAGLLSVRGTVQLSEGKLSEGKLDDALATFEEAYVEVLDIYGAQHPQVAVALDDRGSVLTEQRRYAETLELQRSALAIRKKTDSEEAVAGAHHRIAVSLMHTGELDEALEHATRAVRAFRKLSTGPSRVVSAQTHRAAVLSALQRHPEAIAQLEQTQKLATEALGAEHPDSVAVQLLLGRALVAANEHARAVSALTLSVAQLGKLRGTDPIELAQAQHLLAVALLRVGDADKAVTVATQSVATFIAHAQLDAAAGARFVLAQALHSASPANSARAVELATQTLRYYQSKRQSKRQAGLAAEVSAWLAAQQQPAGSG